MKKWKSTVFRDTRGVAAVWIVVLLAILTTTGAGFGGYYVADSKAREELKDKDEQISRLKDNQRSDQSNQFGATPTPAPQSAPSQSTTYQSANLGFSVNVPKEWAGKWRYQESGEVGISTASVAFFLINKDTKYQELVAIGRIPQAKYDDAKATGQAVGNPDNFLGVAKGNVYVMFFADGNSVEFKDFTYQQAVTAARAAFKSSFKPL